MFGIFKSKPILSQEDTEFQIATYKWLLKHFGGADFYEYSKLILPTREYFPAKVSNANDVATETFNAVKKYAGIECSGQQKPDKKLSTFFKFNRAFVIQG